MSFYPSWRYHPDKEPFIVQTVDEDQALGAGWVDTPAKFSDAVEEIKPKRRGQAPLVPPVEDEASEAAVHDTTVIL